MEGGRDPTTVQIMKNKKETKEKRWIFRCDGSEESTEKIEKIASSLGIDPIIARLLYNRGYTDTLSAKKFIDMESEMLSNPFDMADMQKAVDRIARAVNDGEKITVYGDYDVDGVTSVCTLYLYLSSLGAQVEYYIPNRAGEGYGVSNSAIEAIANGGTKLIITVDTGITANDEVLFAKERGVDFIVTDHHECRSDLPLAEAVVNPHRPDCPYPFKELAGVGVVFKLICAYEEAVLGYSRKDAARHIFRNYADLVAIGTIADVMPIKEENRIIVKLGLDMIENSPRVGISALIEASSSKLESQRIDNKKRRTKITSGYVGYTLAPRINAAGRIKTASVAVRLFLSEDSDTAMTIAEELCRTNKERQAEENKIMEEAYLKIEKYDIEKNPVIVLDADNWHHGVIGIVASRITEKYSRPSILVSFEGNDGVPAQSDVGKGSGRSIKGMNLVDALCYCSDHLVKFGGHELAAGLSVTRGEIDNFRALINEYAKNNLTKEDMVSTVEVDCELEFTDVTLALAEALLRLEPYGVGNPVPTFVLRGVTVNEISSISAGKHTKLILGDGKYTIPAMYFSQSPSTLGIYVGDKIDVLFNVDVNNWGGRKCVQLIVRDITHTAAQKLVWQREEERFGEIWAGGFFAEEENLFPTRQDFAEVYRLLSSALRSGTDTMSHRDILSRLSRSDNGARIGYVKLKIIIMVMKELNIVTIDEIEDEVYKFGIHYSTTKTDLEKSTLLRKLRSQMTRGR